MATDPYQIRSELITSLDRFRQLQTQWNLLAPGESPSSPAFAHEWFASWLEAFGSSCRIAIIAVFNREDLVGVAPLQQVHRPFRALPCRQLRFLYNRHGPRCSFLLRGGYHHLIDSLFKAALNLTKWDVAVLQNIPEDSALYKHCANLVSSGHRGILLRKTATSPFLRIAGSWEDFYRSRSKGHRRHLRVKEKRILASGHMSIDHFADAASCVAAIPQLMAIGEKSWKARSGRAIGSQPESGRFYASLAESFGKNKEASVWLLKIDSEPVAFEFHLQRDKRALGLRAEFSEEYRELGVGSVLDKEIIKALFNAGFEEYDMGGDADFYKLRWTQDARQHYDCLIFGDSPWGRLLSVVERWLVKPSKKVLQRGKKTPDLSD